MTARNAPAQLLGLLFGYRISQAISVAASLRIADALAQRPDRRGARPELSCDPRPCTGSCGCWLQRTSCMRTGSEILAHAAGGAPAVGCSRLDARTGDPPGVGPRSTRPTATWSTPSEPARTRSRPTSGRASGSGGAAGRPRRRSSTGRWRHGARLPPRCWQPRSTSGRWGPSRTSAAGLARCSRASSLHPSLRGIVFDQPAVVAEAEPVLERAGVRDRAELVGGDFFVDVPQADVYVMKSILHDWSDEDSIRILRTIRSRATSSGNLLVIERVLGGPNEDIEGKLSDLHMMVMPGGLERTLDEWRSVLARVAGSSVERAARGRLADDRGDARPLSQRGSERRRLYTARSWKAPARNCAPRRTPSRVKPAFSSERASATLSTSVSASTRL